MSSLFDSIMQGYQQQPQQQQRKGMRPEVAAALMGIGSGMTQLGMGQPVNMAPAAAGVMGMHGQKFGGSSGRDQIAEIMSDPVKRRAFQQLASKYPHIVEQMLAKTMFGMDLPGPEKPEYAYHGDAWFNKNNPADGPVWEKPDDPDPWEGVEIIDGVPYRMGDDGAPVPLMEPPPDLTGRQREAADFANRTAQPGTPEWDQAYNDYLVGQGTEAGASSLTTANATTAQKVVLATNQIGSLLDDYQRQIGGFKPGLTPSVEKDSIRTTYTQLLLAMKELQNLGVLNGPDLDLMKQMIIDPTSFESYAADATGFLPVQERGLANIENLRRTIGMLAGPHASALQGDAIVPNDPPSEAPAASGPVPLTPKQILDMSEDELLDYYGINRK